MKHRSDMYWWIMEKMLQRLCSEKVLRNWEEIKYMVKMLKIILMLNRRPNRLKLDYGINRMITKLIDVWSISPTNSLLWSSEERAWKELLNKFILLKLLFISQLKAILSISTILISRLLFFLKNSKVILISIYRWINKE